MTNLNQRTILKVENLKTYFEIDKRFISRQKKYVYAVDDVSLDVKEGETLGIVGESGCGKSTLLHSIMRTVPVTSGRIEFDGKDVLSLNKKELRQVRKDKQIIFQDPFSSLDPRMTIGEIIEEPLIVHGVTDVAERRRRVLETFEYVELLEDFYYRYPHEFSGGQRQRVSIARSLVLKPKLILCDEPVSALDVSIQSQILNLLNDLQKQLDLTYIFVSHALNVIRHVSDRVCVMYLGKVLETADVEELFERPKHPYTAALLSSIPIPDPTVNRVHASIKGELPSPSNPPSGCRFHTRCPYVKDKCINEEPVLEEKSSSHIVACHFSDEIL
ncbi:ABC transporter ATP-binding protein [Paratissierella segnis]|jgi:oligopeptide/dipeptide ABC transporter ATP-binding protein|uniref:ATP-binding cassette domain-containing protein n=1 Tax=Paratissierella segnis TaxID=2763679 RepID=A0A926ESJ5_9FIRM|nr:oligopeptide/dipeptide ABC transporter ATP-binding protein [Paratissierella segnis]MBC8587438.1 ATP-binding cassette domain-containing protein [Paratissierella segnis]